MAVVGELMVAILGTNVGLTSALAKSEAELKGFSAAATSHGNAASNALNAVGVAGAAVAVGVAAYLGEAVHSAIGFQDALAQVGLTAHLSGDALDTLGGAVEQASVGTTSSSVTMVRALIPVAGELERITGGALTARDAINVLTAAESLHVTTGLALDASLKAIADTLLVYHLQTDSAASVASLLFDAQAQLGLGVDTVAGALQRLQPRIAGSGVDLLTMLAITREIEPTLGTSQRAIQRLGSVLADFITPSATAQATLASLHVSLTDANGAFIGIGPALDRIRTALAGVQDPLERNADLTALFGANAQLAGVLLAGGSAGLEANRTALTAQGTAAAAAAQRNADLHQRFLIAQATVATLTDAIGSALLPALTSVANAVLPIINTIGQWVTLNPQLASQILLVGGALGAFLFVLANVGPAIALLNLPLLALVGGVALLATAWVNNWNGMRDTVSGVVGTIGGIIGTLVAAFQGIVGAIMDPGHAVSQLRDVFGAASPQIAAVITTIRSIVVTAFTFLSQNVIPALGQAFNWIATNVLPPLGQAFGAVAGWVRDNWPLISSIANQVGGAVRTVFLTIVGAIQIAWPYLVGIGRVVFPIIGTAATILLNVIRAAFQLIGGIWQGAAIVAKAVADGIGGAWSVLSTIFNAVAQAVGNSIGLITGLINGLVSVVQTVAGVIANFFGWLFGNLDKAGAGVKNLAPTVAPLGPGPSNVAHGGIGVGAATSTAGTIGTALIHTLQYQHGGMVPGSGAQLAIVHGGETVLPAGSGQAIQLTHTTVLELDGEKIGEIIDRRLFGSASGFSSGFTSGSPVTGA